MSKIDICTLTYYPVNSQNLLFIICICGFFVFLCTYSCSKFIFYEYVCLYSCMQYKCLLGNCSNGMPHMWLQINPLVVVYTQHPFLFPPFLDLTCLHLLPVKLLRKASPLTPLIMLSRLSLGVSKMPSLWSIKPVQNPLKRQRKGPLYSVIMCCLDSKADLFVPNVPEPFLNALCSF